MPFSLALPIDCPFVTSMLPVCFFKAYSGDFEAIQKIFRSNFACAAEICNLLKKKEGYSCLYTIRYLNGSRETIIFKELIIYKLFWRVEDKIQMKNWGMPV
ncbi:MAG: hypothetical protein RAO94_12210 [Candidatus Stygibacter australis]|nr:hypothetical protein [Candidatus Stygibacter australis]